MRKIAFIVCFCCHFTVNAQIEWQKCLGGSSFEWPYDIKQTSDGGYIVGGISMSQDGDITNSHGNYDAWVVKLDDGGNIQWQKSYGGSYSENITSISEAIGGGYFMIITSKSWNGDFPTGNGGGDCWIIKTDQLGNIEWKKNYGGSEDEDLAGIQLESNNGFILAGTTRSNDIDVSGSHGNLEGWILKLDTLANLEWQKCYGGTDADALTSIQPTLDGGYILSGWSYSNDGDISIHYGIVGWQNGTEDGWVVKLDSAGNIEWEKTLGGTNQDRLSCIRTTSDGGYIVTGISNSNDIDVSGNHGSWDYWVVKLNGSGELIWQKSLGGTGNDQAFSVEEIDDGYVIAGWSSSSDGDINNNLGGGDFWILKLDTNGGILWKMNSGSSGGELVWDLAKTSDGGFVIAGTAALDDGDVSGYHGGTGQDYWIVKYGNTTGIEDVNSKGKFSLYPNPTTSTLTIQNASGLYHLSDITGKTLLSGLASGETFTLDISTLSSGVYFLTLSEGGQQVVRKVVKQ